MSFIDDMLNRKNIEKEAAYKQGENKEDHFEKKVASNPWVSGLMNLDEKQVEAEYQEKLRQEAMVLGKTAAQEFETPKEVVNKDFERDVKILSDYALAEMLAEARGHEKQNTSEMFYELKEKAKSEVASSREKAEKALLELIPDHTMLDWKKAFEKFTKDAKPAEASEKDLFKTDVPEKEHDFEHPTEEKFKVPADQDKAIPGNGREADERTDATKEAGVLQDDITKGLGKDASLKVEALYPSDFPEGAPENPDSIKVFQKTINIGKNGKIDVLGSVKHYSFGPDTWSAYVTTTSHDATGKSNMSSNGAILWQGEFKSKEEAIAALQEWSQINVSASLKAKAHCGHCDTDKTADAVTPSSGAPMDENVIREAFKQMVEGAGEEIIKDMLMMYMPVSEMKGMLDDFSDEGEFTPGEEHYEHAGIPMAVSHLKKHLQKKADEKKLHTPEEGCPICGGNGKDLKNGQTEHMACGKCGVTYTEPEIKSHASKADVIKKVAELQKTAEVASRWAVVTDENGQEVLARISSEVTNEKKSEEDIKDELIK